MGSIWNSGTRDRPRYIVKWKELDGRWRQKVLEPSIASKADAKRILDGIERKVTEGRWGLEAPKPVERMETALREFAAGLTNRAVGQDRHRIAKHLIPYWGKTLLRDCDVHAICEWLEQLKRDGIERDAKKARGEIKARGSSVWNQRSSLTLLSRFLTWAVKKGKIPVNPARSLSREDRPLPPLTRKPWLDERLIWPIFYSLAEPYRYMFYLGNASSARPGEIVGLRMADLAPELLEQNTFRVRFNADAPLKEDRRGGKTKYPPINGEQAARILDPWIRKRKLEGAGPDDRVFPGTERAFRNGRIFAWAKIRAKFNLPDEVTWYVATRHTRITLNAMKGGENIKPELARAAGHRDMKHIDNTYNQYVPRGYSALLTAPIPEPEIDPGAAPVIPIGRARR